MGGRRTLLITILLLAPATSQAVERSRSLPRLESNRGNFSAFADNADWRRALIREAEANWMGWQRLFPEGGVDPSPAILIVDRAAYPRPRGVGSCVTSVAESDAGLWKIQIDVFSKDALGDGSLSVEMLRAMALRHMHAKSPPRSGEVVVQPPRWMLAAVAEEVRRKAAGIPRNLVEKLVSNGETTDLGGFLALEPKRSDTGISMLYRARALALLEVLRDEPAGLEKLLQRGDAPLDSQALASLFPKLGGASGLSRRWTLALVKTSSPSNLASLSLAETNTKLTAILGGEGESLADLLAEKARSRGGAYSMRVAAASILQLELPAHPLLRAVLTDYREMLETLSRKPKTDVRARILANEALRLESVALGQSASELLDWAEIELQPSTRPFVHKPEFEPAKRDDPYARVLDRIEAVGR